MSVKILIGDCRARLRELPAESVHCCVTSPPYFGLRDYGIDGQIGLEQTAEDFVAEMVAVFREVKRVLRNDGTLWLNLGDSYAGSGKGRNGDGSVGLLNSAKQRSNSGAVFDVDKFKRIERGNGRWGGGNNPATGDIKPKDLIGIPWMVAFALRADGWYLRQDIIWHKPNPMPESVTDRCTKSHEYIFLLSKSDRYFYDFELIKENAVKIGTPGHLAGGRGERAGTREGLRGRAAGNKNHKYVSEYENSESQEHRTKSGLLDVADKEWLSRNKRSVWTVPTAPFSEAHFATYPPSLIEPCILAGSPRGGAVLDPFGGAGTTGLVADRLHRDAILIELNPEYADIAKRRLHNDAPLFVQAEAAE